MNTQDTNGWTAVSSGELPEALVKSLKALMILTPIKPNAITWERGNDILTYWQDDLVPKLKAYFEPIPTPPLAIDEAAITPTSDAIPRPGKSFWYWMENGVEALLSTTKLEHMHQVREYMKSIGAVKWIYAKPPYGIPKAPK